ncbi:MAG: NAD(P)-dependent oxidoreductase [Desulfobacteraceae bacterium]|nr:NAD(P)-dependent oxidoreductase [Desulfobacteraceae bacterium]
MKKVGFIGLGAMGRPMATNLLKKGYQLTLFDLIFREGDEEYWRRLGGDIGKSSKDVAQGADVIITVLPSSENVKDAVLGESGVIHGVEKGSIVIDMSTIDPITTKEVGAALEEKGVDMIDAPVARTVKAAEQGTLAIFIGGKKEIFEKCRDLLAAMGSDLFYIGELGTGELVKIINNQILAGTVALLSEALVMGVKGGVAPDTLLEALGNGSANSFALQNHIKNAVMEGKFEEGVFSVEYMLKDIGFALKTGASLNVPLFFTGLTSQFYQQGIAAGVGKQYHPAVIRPLEEMTGVKVRSKG